MEILQRAGAGSLESHDRLALLCLAKGQAFVFDYDGASFVRVAPALLMFDAGRFRSSFPMVSQRCNPSYVAQLFSGH